MNAHTPQPPSASEHNPRRLPIATLADAGAALQGQTPLRELPRLASACPGSPADTLLHWQAQFSTRQPPGQSKEVWLALQAEVPLTLECQRCLQAMPELLQVQRAFRFAPDEATAARLDEELVEDVLVISRHFDLLELIEDELIMALPFAPRHADCQPAASLQDDSPVADEQPHPFAVLQQLKHKPPQSDQ